MSQLFNSSVLAAASRASRTNDEHGRHLLRQVITLDTTAVPLARDDYRASYAADPLAFYDQMSSAIEAVYQQIHAAVTSAAVFVGATAEPSLKVKSLASLESEAEASRAHSLAAALRAQRRDVGLLRWLLVVRNKAVQHRAENGYLAERWTVLQMGLSIARKPDPPEPARGRRARELLRGLGRSYDFDLDPGSDHRQAVTYLDLASHAFREHAPAEYDTARYVVELAGAHELIVSRDMLANTDRALATLIRLAPENPDSPAAKS